MKPAKWKCKEYCELHPCTRSTCERGLIFKHGITSMASETEYAYYREKEKLRLFNEPRNNRLNN